MNCHNCGSEEQWVPTFCNHQHCAECFEPTDEEHECAWDGAEHASYFPLDHGAVWNASCAECREAEEPCSECRG